MKYNSTDYLLRLTVAALLVGQSARAQAPAAISFEPARNAVAAPVAGPVVVGFTQAITAVSAPNLRVYGSLRRGRRPGTVSGGGTASLRFAPVQAFAPGEQVSVTVPATLLNAAGSGAGRQVYQFTAATAGTGHGVFADTAVVARTHSRDQLLGDIDNDGDLDLLTTAGLYAVSAYRNDGSGRFAPAGRVAVGSTPSGLALADFNQDGALDLIAGDADNPTVAIALNDGAGGFGLASLPSQTLAVGATVAGIAVGDVDGDGDLDFVSANAGGSSASVGLNGGNGLFASVTTYAVGLNPSAVQLADLDLDGDLDLLTSNRGSSTISLCLNNGNGGFGAATSVTTGGPPSDLVLADIDGDGDLDLLATCTNGLVSIRLNFNGGFASVPGLALPTGSAPTGLRAGDVDADGDLDLVVAQGPGGQVVTFLNAGNGSFSAQAGALLLGSGAISSGVALGDADGDGDLDLITADALTGQVVLGRGEVAPVLSSFSPVGGAPGTAITLTGAYLQGTRRIAFAGPLANVAANGFVVNAAGTQITGVVVPSGAVSGPVNIATAGGTATSAASFAVSAAQLLVQQRGTVLPPLGPGFGFGSQVVATTSAAVLFTLSNPGSQPLALAGVSATGSFALTGAVPASIPAGGAATIGVVFQPAAVGAQGGTLVIASDAVAYPSYTVLLTGTGVLPVPAVAGFVPASARAGSIVAVRGTNLSGATAVVFAGTSNRTVTTGFNVNSTGTEITGVEVPAGAVTGLAVVTTPGGTSPGAAFTVLPPLPPTLTACSPASAPEGATLTLTGTNLLGTTQVVLTGVSAAFQVLNSTTLTAVVPTNAATGTLTAITPGGYSNGFPFQVVPRITRLSAIAGPVGASVLVYGTSMGAVTSAQINGVAASVSAIYGREVTITVPPGATSGQLTVSTASGTSNALPFTVTVPMTLTRVSPTSGPAGTALTLTGTNLAGATTIVFTGTGVNTLTSGFAVNATGTQITGVVVPSGAHTGPIYVLSPNGQTIGYASSFTLVGVAGANAPTWQMLNTMYNTPLPGTTPGGGGYVFGSAADASGNVFVVGQFFGSVAFGPTILRCNYSGNRAAFVAKWSPATRDYVWAQMFESSGGIMTSVAVGNGGIYVAGYFEVNRMPVLVAKFTDLGTAGALAWTQAPTGLVDANAVSVAVQGTGVYLAGNFHYIGGPTTTFGTTALTTAGDVDGYVAKLIDAGSAATWAWAKRLGGPLRDEVKALAVSGSTVYVAGRFESAGADFDALRLSPTASLAGNVTPDGFVAKLTDAGSTAGFGWAQALGGAASQDEVSALAVQGTSVYVAGKYENEARFGPQTLGSATAYGGVNGFVAKLTDAGSAAGFVWAQPVLATVEVGLTGLAVSGNALYLVGSTRGGSRFGATTTLEAAQFPNSCFVAKLVDGGSAGSFGWVQVAGGPAGNGFAQAVCTQGNQVYVGGYVNGTVGFGPLSTPVGFADSYGFLAALTDTGISTAAALAGPARPALAVFPNPARGKLTVLLPAGLVAGPAALALLDALGRTVRTETLRPLARGVPHEFDLAGLPAGLYTLRLTAPALVAVRRVVVE